MTVIWWIILYIVGMFAVVAWDAFVGFNDGNGGEVEFDGNNAPPLLLAVWFWPLIIAFVIVCAPLDFLKRSKRNRQTRQANKKKIRIARQREIEISLEEVDEELKNMKVG
jgi:H+/Cl- antiporter ClcA